MMAKKHLIVMAALLALAAILSVVGYYKKADADPFWRSEKKIYLGNAYASSSVNVPVFREQAAITTSVGRFASYYDNNGDVRVALIDNTGQVRSFVAKTKLPENLLADGHCAINLGYTTDGYLHVIYGSHDTEPYYFTFPAARDKVVEYEKNPPEAVQWNEKITYPQFYEAGGESWMVYRRGTDIYVKVYDLPSKQWRQKYETPILTAESADSVYINKLAIEDKSLVLSWVYRLPDTESRVINDGIYFARSGDGGKTWFDAVGRERNLPLRRGDVPKLIEAPSGIGLMNQNGAFLKNGDYYLAVLEESQATDRFQIFLYVVTAAGKICVREISDNRSEFELIGRGTLSLPLGRPQVAVSDKNVHVIYRQNGEIIIASAPADEACFAKWAYHKLPEVSVDGWEPNIDWPAWRNEHRLIMYFQSVRQGKNDTVWPGAATPAYLYELQEK